MSAHSTYDYLRHLADSWGLVAMGGVYLLLVAWPFFASDNRRTQSAATMIFEDDENG